MKVEIDDHELRVLASRCRFLIRNTDYDDEETLEVLNLFMEFFISIWAIERDEN
tara:strand:- start:602 stop:763 length:162 start_codon:yes stop_codon:yes gene_type:complete